MEFDRIFLFKAMSIKQILKNGLHVKDLKIDSKISYFCYYDFSHSKTKKSLSHYPNLIIFYWYFIIFLRIIPALSNKIPSVMLVLNRLSIKRRLTILTFLQQFRNFTPIMSTIYHTRDHDIIFVWLQRQPKFRTTSRYSLIQISSDINF